MWVCVSAKSFQNKSFEGTGKNIVCNTEALSLVIYILYTHTLKKHIYSIYICFCLKNEPLKTLGRGKHTQTHLLGVLD